MEKNLTLMEMINYEIPKTFKLPVEELKLHKSAWRIPKLNSTKVFEATSTNLMLRHCYKDTSREKQKSFLTISGKIASNKQKSKSLNRMLGFLPSSGKTSSRPAVSCRSKRKVQSNHDLSSKRPELPSSCFRKKLYEFKFTPLGNMCSFLAKLSNQTKNS